MSRLNLVATTASRLLTSGMPASLLFVCLLVSSILAASASAQAQAIYRCGAGYSDQPCANSNSNIGNSNSSNTANSNVTASDNGSNGNNNSPRHPAESSTPAAKTSPAEPAITKSPSIDSRTPEQKADSARIAETNARIAAGLARASDPGTEPVKVLKPDHKPKKGQKQKPAKKLGQIQGLKQGHTQGHQQDLKQGQIRVPAEGQRQAKGQGLAKAKSGNTTHGRDHKQVFTARVPRKEKALNGGKKVHPVKKVTHKQKKRLVKAHRATAATGVTGVTGTTGAAPQGDARKLRNSGL